MDRLEDRLCAVIGALYAAAKRLGLGSPAEAGPYVT
jgi:hypothetical protein